MISPSFDSSGYSTSKSSMLFGASRAEWSLSNRHHRMNSSIRRSPEVADENNRTHMIGQQLRIEAPLAHCGLALYSNHNARVLRSSPPLGTASGGEGWEPSTSGAGRATAGILTGRTLSSGMFFSRRGPKRATRTYGASFSLPPCSSLLGTRANALWNVLLRLPITHQYVALEAIDMNGILRVHSAAADTRKVLE